MNCPKCNKEISSGAIECEHCGIVTHKFLEIQKRQSEDVLKEKISSKSSDKQIITIPKTKKKIILDEKQSYENTMIKSIKNDEETIKRLNEAQEIIKLPDHKAYNVTIVQSQKQIRATIKRMFDTHGPYQLNGMRLDSLDKVEVLLDSSRITSSQSSSKYKAGSVLGGAIVGGVIAGAPGAIIGGLTREQTTQTEMSSETKITLSLQFENGNILYLFVKNLETYHFLLSLTDISPMSDDELEKQRLLSQKVQQNRLGREQIREAEEKRELFIKNFLLSRIGQKRCWWLGIAWGATFVVQLCLLPFCLLYPWLSLIVLSIFFIYSAIYNYRKKTYEEAKEKAFNELGLEQHERDNIRYLKTYK